MMGKLYAPMLLLFCMTAPAAELHVDANGTNAVETGSIERPYRSIQAAVDAAADGDAIKVARGVYAENVRIENKTIALSGGYGPDFQFQGAPGDTTIQGDGANAAVSLVEAGETVLDRFRITGGTGSTDFLPWTLYGGGVYCYGGSPTISNNLIEENAISHEGVNAGDTFGGGIGAEDSNVRIIGNTIRNNRAGRGGGISVRGGNAAIRDNLIQSNTGVSDHGGGIYIFSPSAELSNNVIEFNEIGRDLGYGWGGGVIAFNPGNFTRMSFNVIRHNYAPSLGAGVFIDEGAQAVLEHELIYGNECEPGSAIGGVGVYLDGGTFDGEILGSSAALRHCTVADNPCDSSAGGNGLLLEARSSATVHNSIFWGNGGDDFFVDDTSSLAVTYTDSEEPFPGEGNLSLDPLFYDPADGDYHVKSTWGRWADRPISGGNEDSFIDDVDSPCIDAGDPASDYSNEPLPNGGRVNMGVYGNTLEASLSSNQAPPSPTPAAPNEPSPTRFPLGPSPSRTPTQAAGPPTPTPPPDGVTGLTLLRRFELGSADEFTEVPGGFLDDPAGTVSAGAITPGDVEYTDGTGVSVTTRPGEVSLLLFPSLPTDGRVLLIRASVRSTGPGAAIALAAADGAFDGSLATNIVADSGGFRAGYRKMAMIYAAPGGAAAPIFQSANTAGAGDVTVYLDKLEVYAIHPNSFMSTGILYGGPAETVPVPTPTATSGVTPTPTTVAAVPPTPTLANGGGPGGQAYRPVGIGGGGALYSAGMSPFDPNEIYMATDMSGVFRTRDFGRTWSTLDFRQLQGGVNSHVRYTSDPRVLYALNLEGDFRIPSKSVDGGETWVPLPDDPTESEAYLLFADPHSVDRVMLSNWATLYYSDDGGESFEAKYSSNHGGGLLIGGVFWDGDTIIVSTLDGLLVSEDGGGRFDIAPIGGIPEDEVIISMAGAKENGAVRLFASTHDPNVWVDMQGSEIWGSKSVYRLDWGDESWTEVNNGFGDCFRPFFVSMAPNDSDTVYVAGGNIDPCAGVPAVYKTVDGGAEWELAFLTENNQNIATGWMGDGGDLEWHWAETALGFAVSPVDSNRAIITDFGFAHVTDDGGATWRQAYVDEAYGNPAGSPSGRGGAYRTNGVQNTSCWWLHWTGADTVLAAFTDIRGIRSGDGGVSWTAGSALGLPHNSTYQFIEDSRTGTLYGCTSSVHDLYQSTYLQDARIDGGEGSVVYSTDEGRSWEVLRDFGHPTVWMALDEGNDAMYVSVVHSAEGGIYATGNLSAGENAPWRRLASPPRTEGHPFSIHVLDNGDLLASYSGRRNADGAFTESSGVFLSTNGGDSWEDLSHPNMRRWTKDLVIDPRDPAQNTWYACVFSHWGTSNNEVGGIFRTEDRGRTWRRISDLYRVESVAFHPGDPDILYASTEVQGLWKSTNIRGDNPTFAQVEAYPFRHPVRMFFHPVDSNELWVTSFGGGIKVLDVSG